MGAAGPPGARSDRYRVTEERPLTPARPRSAPTSRRERPWVANQAGERLSPDRASRTPTAAATATVGREHCDPDRCLRQTADVTSVILSTTAQDEKRERPTAPVLYGKRRSRATAWAMSKENVEFVRHIYESGLFDRDPDELLQLATPDVEYVNPPYAVEPGVRRGLVAVAQAMRRFAEVWETSSHELRELYDCGDAVVAPSIGTYAAGEASGSSSTKRRTPGSSARAGSLGSNGGRISARLSRPRASRIRPPASGRENPSGVRESR